MKYILTILFLFVSSAFAEEGVISSAKNEQIAVSQEGINFQEWESEFDTSMGRAKTQVRKCESKSKNCQFEKFQALDPSFDMIH